MITAFLLIHLFIGFHSLLAASNPTRSIQGSQLEKKIDRISLQPTTIIFQNSLELPDRSGHIQGIQKMLRNESEYYFISGSSNSYSYFSILKTGETENRLISTTHILESPFRHAGGFQIYKNLMAIGVEDNEKKNRSKVLIYEVNNPEAVPSEPWVTIDRYGTARRATAGCVAITQVDNKVIIIVGDWDTVNLDFYVIEHKLLGVDSAALTVEYSLNPKKADKSDWVDEQWLAYQNINLLQDEEGQLWLAGTATNVAGENILDIYKLSHHQFETFSLIKAYSKNFGVNAVTSFRWGAGIYIDDERIQIMATPDHIEDQNSIQIYE